MKKFGLDQPLWKQYLTYLKDMARFDFNYSIANYPRKVIDIIGEAMPWTITLAGDHHPPGFHHRATCSAR